MANDNDAIDYEAEYNNRARVPEHPQLIAAWHNDAAAFRDEMAPTGRAEYGLAYGDHERHKLDIFRPETDRNGPFAMFIHGGYWQMLDREPFSHMARGLVAHGVPVALPSYRLCPDVTVPDTIEDMRAAAHWLWNRHGRKLLVIGHSAGGHLAACLLATDWQARDASLPEHLVPAAVPFSGLFDLEPIVHTSVNDKLGMTPQVARDASPLAWPAPAGGWLEAYVGGDESSEYHRQTDSIVKVWGGHGTETQMRVVAGKNHFNVVTGLADPQSDMVTAIATLAHSLE